MPGCTSCTQSSPSITGYNPVSCTNSTSSTTNSNNVIYTGPTLSCTGITTNSTLTSILQTLDPLICAIGGNFSSYNTACLAPINTQKQFVEGISAYVCNTQTQLSNFINVTYAAYVTSINIAIGNITNPNLICTSVGVVNSDTLVTILSKYCAKFGSIDTLLDPSALNWGLCYAVSPIPTTPNQAFNVLISQICLLKSLVNTSGIVLPVFNNVGSCLPSPGASDSLVDTVNKIKTRLCQTGTIDNTAISWGCITQPAGAQDLQSTLQNIITVVTNNAKKLPTVFSGDFVVTNVDNSNLCLGKSIALAVPSSQDRKVAATSGDLTPGVLQDKLQAGTNMVLDYITTPGKVILNATGGGGGGLTLADNTDATADYLINKVNGGVPIDGVTLTTSVDTTNPLSHQVSFQIGINPITLFTVLIQSIYSDPGLQAAFCAAVAACPSPCSAPSNVLVTYTAGPASSTSTTSTTTP